MIIVADPAGETQFRAYKLCNNNNTTEDVSSIIAKRKCLWGNTAFYWGCSHKGAHTVEGGSHTHGVNIMQAKSV